MLLSLVCWQISCARTLPLHLVKKKEGPLMSWRWPLWKHLYYCTLIKIMSSGWETNASKFAIGGVLSVKGDDSNFRPVAYMSHSMTPPECNYPIHNKEMLAIIKATECWRHYLEAMPYAFKIYTHHNNLMYFMQSQNISKRLVHWPLWMSCFNYLLVYRKGTAMHVTNLLSRHSDHYIHSWIRFLALPYM